MYKQIKIASALFALILTLHVHAFSSLKWAETSVTMHPDPYTEKVLAEFHYTNLTKSPIRIKKIETSCGCMTTSESAKIIQPGSKGVLPITVNLKGKYGVIKEVARVLYDDSKEADGLVITIINPKPMKVSPPFLYWKSGDEKEKSISLTPHPHLKLKYLQMIEAPAAFVTELVTKAENKSYVIKAKPRKAQTPVREKLVVEWKVEGRELESLTIYLMVK
ncbi:MAG: DUF1573 domain-containing protein [Verrucomicrobiota bacterium]